MKDCLGLKVLMGVVLFFCLAVTANASERQVLVFVGDKEPEFTNEPITNQGRTLVEMRPIMDALDLNVTWEPNEQKIGIEGNGVSVQLSVGSQQARINGAVHSIDVPPQVRDGRTLVPLRFISEATGMDVSWSNEAHIAHIHEGELPVVDTTVASTKDEIWQEAKRGEIGPFSQEDREKTLAEIVHNYGMPDARHDGTPESDDTPFVVYGDFDIEFNGTAAEVRDREWHHYLSQGEVTGIRGRVGNQGSIEEWAAQYGSYEDSMFGLQQKYFYSVGGYQMTLYEGYTGDIFSYSVGR
ncbi:copper amine oxidase N-terminal domain-containing protein [Salsuginibacillus kocurii]|uniref:copper amine oxidase N-terminal domain-containing protein n=1 Tax=Salsuginibacillus kocurii TaxID=427078 RepID=UPI00037FB154|nr:copper amine oxidase N-terminal domain-containing protein [Salsuginibacillus kocurii]